MPGNINRAGSNPGSLVQVVLIAPFAISADQQGEINDWNCEAEEDAENTTFILQMSNDGFSGSIVEKDRLVLPVADSYTRTYGAESGNGRMIIPPGYQCRVVAAQATAIGSMSSSIIGQTRKLDSVHGGRQVDALGDDSLDL